MYGNMNVKFKISVQNLTLHNNINRVVLILRLGLTTSPHLYVDCPEIWEPKFPGTLQACTGIALHLRSVECIGVTEWNVGYSTELSDIFR
jgi:hypothetical protein